MGRRCITRWHLWWWQAWQLARGRGQLAQAAVRCWLMQCVTHHCGLQPTALQCRVVADVVQSTGGWCCVLVCPESCHLLCPPPASPLPPPPAPCHPECCHLPVGRGDDGRTLAGAGKNLANTQSGGPDSSEQRMPWFGRGLGGPDTVGV